MNRAVIRERSCTGKAEGKSNSAIHSKAVKQTLIARNRMCNIAIVCPGQSGTLPDRDGNRREEIVAN